MSETRVDLLARYGGEEASTKELVEGAFMTMCPTAQDLAVSCQQCREHLHPKWCGQAQERIAALLDAVAARARREVVSRMRAMGGCADCHATHCTDDNCPLLKEDIDG